MADKTKAMGGDWNPGWCLSPKKGLERAMVKLSGTNRSYPYRAYRICHIGDLATVGYWYDKMHPSATSGTCFGKNCALDYFLDYREGI